MSTSEVRASVALASQLTPPEVTETTTAGIDAAIEAVKTRNLEDVDVDF